MSTVKHVRLDKFLSDRTAFSRSEIKQKLRRGDVKVNGETIRRPEFKISPDDDDISFQGQQVNREVFRYYMLNKPAGVVSATKDSQHQTVLSLLPPELGHDLFPVGRLDKDSEGLLLLTNDGAMAHRLLSPKKHIPKTYYVELDQPVKEEDITAFSDGLSIGDDKLTMPAVLSVSEPCGSSELNDCQAGVRYSCTVTITEGRFHQIKRMFAARGKKVLYLKRLCMGSLFLDEKLPAGKFRPLTATEIEQIHSFDDTGSMPGAPVVRRSENNGLTETLRQAEAVLFDLDGTLIDSMWVWPEIDVEFMAKYGLTPHQSLGDEVEGMSFSETAAYFKEYYHLPLSVEHIKEIWNQMAYEKYRTEVPMKAGAEQLLRYLNARNVPTAIATSNSVQLVNTIASTHHVLQTIDCVVTSCDVNAGKPSPDVYLEAAKRLHVRPENCLVFEDIYNGIVAGKRAGMKVCAVWDHFSRNQTLRKKEAADYYIRTFEEISIPL